MKKIGYPIKVLQVIHSAQLTGPQQHILTMLSDFDRKDFQVDVACPSRGFFVDKLKKMKITTIPIEFKPALDLKSLFQLYLLLRKRKYQIVHAHSGRSGTFCRIAGTLARVPVIVLTEHLATFGHAWIKSELRRKVHFLTHCISNRLVDKVIAVSEAARKSFIERQGIPPQKTVTIYNCLNIERFTKLMSAEGTDLKKEFNIKQKEKVVGLVGRLDWIKGHRYLVLAAKEVIKKMPETKFLIVGEGKIRNELEALIQEQKLDKYFFLTGFQKDIPGIMNILDVLVLPSLEWGHESFGLVLIEAMSAGKPVIASDILGLPEVVVDGKNGFLVPQKDHHALAQKILLLLGNAQLSREMGQFAKNYVEEKFNSSKIVREIENLYRELLISKKYKIEQDNQKVREEMKRFYQTAHKYMERIDSHGEKAYQEYVSFVTRIVPRGKTILDLGCGTGLSSYMLTKNGYKVIGADISPLSIEKASKTFGDKSSNLDYIVADGMDLTFEEEAFDVVSSFLLIEHISDIPRALSEMLRVTKKGGMIIVLSPSLLSPFMPLSALINLFLKRKNKTPIWGEKNVYRLIKMLLKNTALSMRKKFSSKVEFLYREPILENRFDFIPDNDACYLSSPIDLKRWFEKRKGLEVLKYQRESRGGRIFPNFVTGIHIVVKKLS